MSTELNSQTFSGFIASGLALVDFWAPWCGPCRMQMPIMDQVAEQMPDVKVGKVNVDENTELAAQFGVNTIPYLIIFKDGKKVSDFIGMRQANVLTDALMAAR
ncbi:MAG: thioredoxin [Verrucomicrobiota bacterium]|nr:thioredoxin [Verrucomicrobiota bacterium]